MQLGPGAWGSAARVFATAYATFRYMELFRKGSSVQHEGELSSRLSMAI